MSHKLKNVILTLSDGRLGFARLLEGQEIEVHSINMVTGKIEKAVQADIELSDTEFDLASKSPEKYKLVKSGKKNKLVKKGKEESNG